MVSLTESREKTLKLISLFSSARLLSEVFYFFRGILLAKILGPSLLGIWTQMKISLLFMAYSNLGTSEAMFREVPYAVGKGCQARADRIKRAAWGLNFITSSILALIVFGYFFWFGRIWEAISVCHGTFFASLSQKAFLS